MKFLKKKTKIVCTIGPASQEPAVLAQLIRSGMNVARINFAHGDFAAHAETIANIRKAEAATGRRAAIMGDLHAPKMWIGELAKGVTEGLVLFTQGTSQLRSGGTTHISICICDQRSTKLVCMIRESPSE